MTYLEQLRAARDKPQVAFQEFSLLTGRYPLYLFCFFEGKDNDYYVPRIKQFTQNHLPIKCGNRDSVLRVHALIANRSEYQAYKKAFFIDRDFHPPLPPQSPPIFESPCYSVENLYVSVEVFREILINTFHLSVGTDEPELNACLECYAQRQAEFHQAVCLFNAWYACLIEQRNLTGVPTGVNLADKLPKGFVSMSLDAVTAHYDLAMLKEKFPDAAEVDNEALAGKLQDFQACDQQKTFRGKYELQFLIQFIGLLLEDAAKNRSFLKSKPGFVFGNSLTNVQALNVFSAYAETPESLLAYLQQLNS